MTPLLGGLISGGASLLGGLLQGKPKTNKGMNSAIRKSNKHAIATANSQEVTWSREIQKKAALAAKVPIVTTQKYGSKEVERSDTQYGRRDVTTYGRTDTTKYGMKETLQSYVDVDAMMAAANKSGFNPVTFLQAGGMQAFTRTIRRTGGQDVTTSRGQDVTQSSGHDRYYRSLTHSGKDVETVTGSNAMQAALVGLDKPAFQYYEGAVDYSTPAQPQTGFGPALGNALTAGTNTYLAQRQQLDDNAFQKSLVQMQLNAAAQRGSGRGYSLGGVPSMSSSYAGQNTNGGNGTSGTGLSYQGIPLHAPPGGWADYESIKKQNETLAGMAEVLDAVDTASSSFWDPKNRQIIQDYTQRVLGLEQPIIQGVRPGSPADFLLKQWNNPNNPKVTQPSWITTKPSRTRAH